MINIFIVKNACPPKYIKYTLLLKKKKKGTLIIGEKLHDI